MGNKEEDKGFVVKDRRFSAEKEGEKDSKPGKEEKKGETLEASQEEVHFPEIDFTHFLLSLSTSALIQLGEVPDPVSKQSAKQLPLAKQTIDIIGMLQEKTKGNLTLEEQRLLENSFTELRFRFVQISEETGKAAPNS